MRFCGLDQALRNSGAAILDGDRFVTAKAFKAKATSQAGAFAEFSDWWSMFLDEYRPDYVAIEEPLRSDMTRTAVAYRPNDAFGQSVVKTKQPLTNMQTLLGLYGIRAIALMWCEAGITSDGNMASKFDPASYRPKNYTECNVQDWRQVIHGVRHAPKGTTNTSEWWKSKAMERCRLLGWEVPSKDAAESALIADWLRIKMTPVTRVRSGDLFAGAK